MRDTSVVTFLLATSLVACAPAPQTGSEQGTGGGGGKADSAWLGATSFELGGTMRGQVRQPLVGVWADLTDSEERQIELVDEQMRFAKNGTEELGFRLNLLSDQIELLRVDIDSSTNPAVASIEYDVTVDLVAPIPFDGQVPTLADISPREFTVSVPVQPIGIRSRVGTACATEDDASDLNYAYYFDANAPGCDAAMVQADISITKVFDRPTTYPEYDQLLNDWGDGTRGFRAALVPAQGDYDPLSRYDAHVQMVQQDLGLVGEPLPNDAGLHFEWVEGQARMSIDVYNPTRTYYSQQFREALGQYQFVMYNGHSNYGTMNLLNDAGAFSDEYQIIMMHSCQSYAYYTRQVFRAKQNTDDPTGWSGADVIATGKSSYPSGSPPTTHQVLRGLMEGMVAVTEGRRTDATDWLRILERMNSVEPGIHYGAAGVRENAWTP